MNSATIIKRVGRALLWVLREIYNSPLMRFIRKWSYRLFVEGVFIVLTCGILFFVLTEVLSPYPDVRPSVTQSLWRVWWIEETPFFVAFNKIRIEFLKAHKAIIPS